MNWTSPADIRRQVQILWDRGSILSALVRGSGLFPHRLKLKGPASVDLPNEFPVIRQWIENLRKEATAGYRIVWREFNHRVVGRNAIPGEIWIDSPNDALRLIGRKAEAAAFLEVLNETQARRREILPWLERRPLRALDLTNDWSRLLGIIDWMSDHPRPGIYLRQIDIPGVDTKFIERHRGVLSELLDIALPPGSICVTAVGVDAFCKRYGFRDKPLRVRYRLLDTRLAVFATQTDQDITVTHATFAAQNPPVQKVFITENETNFLAFPFVPDSLVIFGSGYGFEMLAEAAWIRDRCIHYWGDIDTHGFAILDQLRALFPHVRSFLMDRDTLLAHECHWTTEPKPQKRELSRLTPEEGALYDEIRFGRLGTNVRLEQERIGFMRVEDALRQLQGL